MNRSDKTMQYLLANYTGAIALNMTLFCFFERVLNAFSRAFVWNAFRF